MFWSKKEDKNQLPDIPQTKSFPIRREIPENDDDNEDSEDITLERHSLPSFPDSAMQKGFSQAAIKDAIDTESDEDNIIASPVTNSKFKTVELDDSWEQNSSRNNSGSLEEIHIDREDGPKLEPPPQSLPIMKKNEKFSSKTPKPIEQRKADIFVKIDKFYSARKSLETITIKLSEIDELLKKIRDTKMREEQELSYWEKELESINPQVLDNDFE